MKEIPQKKIVAIARVIHIEGRSDLLFGGLAIKI